MKVAIYSPYLDTFGGGERYMMTIASVLAGAGNNVSVLLDNHLFKLNPENLKNQLSKRFDLNLSAVNFIKAPIGEGSDFFSRFFFFKKYDVLFYLTNGSIFSPTARKNILHIQSPLVGQPTESFWGKLKLKGWNIVIYNSVFTREHSQKNWPLKSEIIYPPVDTDKIKPLKKRKYILSVGRFFGFLKDKKQELLIKTFVKLYKNGQLKDWSLHLAGSAGEGDKIYLEELNKLASKYPVNFYPNIEYDNLVKLYGESSIYWHASGFGENDPIKMEHFGISTVEAMAAGCVPVVFGKGGQLEIIENGVSGFLWNNLEELESITLKITENSILMMKISKQAIYRSKFFSKEKFSEKILEVVKA